MVAALSSSTTQLLYVISFVVFAVAAGLSLAERAIYPALIAAGLALYVAPVALR